MDNAKLARELLTLAKEVSAADDSEEVDEQFASKVRGIKTQLNKLIQKKKRRLKQFGVGVIRPSATVEELVNALQKVIADA